MISSQHRFHGHNSLSYVYRHGRVVRGPVISTKYIRNDRRQTYRAAIVVSKKISKLATDRNRIRRRVYEAIRLLAPKIDGAYDIVVTVFNDTLLTMPYDQLQQMVAAQFRQAGMTISGAPKPAAHQNHKPEQILHNRKQNNSEQGGN